MLTMARAAEVLNYSKYYIYLLAQREKIVVSRVGHRVFIDEEQPKNREFFAQRRAVIAAIAAAEKPSAEPAPK